MAAIITLSFRKLGAAGYNFRALSCTPTYLSNPIFPFLQGGYNLPDVKYCGKKTTEVILLLVFCVPQ